MDNSNNLKNILLKHYKLYPKIQLQDIVKLLYQSEYAGGHMIEDEENSLNRLKDEFSLLNSYPIVGNEPEGIFEDIGSGLCRLHLRGLVGRNIELKTVNKFFVETAKEVKGSIKGFEEKLEVLIECCRGGLLPYSWEDVKSYLRQYKDRGYPLVSHSDTYREYYKPSYRIVKGEYRHFFDLYDRIDALLKRGKTIKISIDGNSGAGKSTLAQRLGTIYDCNIFHMDDFFLRPEQRTEDRLKEIGGNVDYIRFNKEVIDGINGGRQFRYQPYNCQTMSLEKSILVTPKKLNIIEGVYSMHPTLIHSYDLKVFLQIGPEEQSRRILERNGPFMHKKFMDEWIPLEDEYFDKMGIRDKSDLIFGEYNR